MWWLHAWGVVACASAVLAQLRIDQEPVLSPRPARVRDHLAKDEEPSCEQLKAMWRFSKRQARTPELMNEPSSYRDPLMYNEWPVYAAVPRAAPRFRYQYNSAPRETYGRVVTKAPPNVVRAPDYDEMYGILTAPQNNGKVLRYPGPSRSGGGPPFVVPPTRDRFETLKKLIRQENMRDYQRSLEFDQRQGLKDKAAGRGNDDYNAYGEQEPRGLQPLSQEYVPEEPRHLKRPPSGSRQLNQFSRYPDGLMMPRSRRTEALGLPPAHLAPADVAPFAY